MEQPAKITSIRPTARNPQRATVRVGRRVVATLAMQRIEALGLAVGETWDEGLAERVAEAATEDQAMRKAMNRLNRRAMSRRDLDRKLRDLDFDEHVRQKVLDRLTELGYLDDEAFGRALIRETQRARAAGPRLLRQKLFQKGLDRTLIDRLLREARDAGEQDDAERATALARQRLAQMQRLDPATRQRRLYGLLARRGFETDAIDAAMQAIRDELEA